MITQVFYKSPVRVKRQETSIFFVSMLIATSNIYWIINEQKLDKHNLK